MKYFIYILCLTCLLIPRSALAQDSFDNHFDASYFEAQRFAHRGGYINGPENTIFTILKNMKLGVRAVEIDVMMTKDSHLVLFHDDSIMRLLNTPTNRALNDLTLLESKAIPMRDTSMGIFYINTLNELVDTLLHIVPQGKTLNFILELDFKPHGKRTAAAIGELMHLIDKYDDRTRNSLYNYFFVSTFYPKVLKALERSDTHIMKAFSILSNPKQNKIAARLAIWLAPHFTKKYNADIIEPNICLIHKKFVRKWHRKGFLINAYTANTPCEKCNVEQFRIAYTTDCPEDNCPTEVNASISKPNKACKKCACN